VNDTGLLARLALEDILDDAILFAAPDDVSYPLRALFSTLRDQASSIDLAFDLATTLNVYFRVPMDEETTMRLGIEASRVYYRCAAEQVLPAEGVAPTSNLLASLLSTQLKRLRFEAVDGSRVFDSTVHEREPGADETSAEIVAPGSFLCRVTATNMVRARARVRT
jgi:hypothetical protein